MPGRKRHQLLPLMLNRLHIEKSQWTFMAWFKICDSVFINFSSLWTGARMLLLCLDFYISMAVRLQNESECRQLDFHTPGISAFTFFLVLRFLCHSSMKYVFHFAHFYNDWFILSVQLASKIKAGGEGLIKALKLTISHSEADARSCFCLYLCPSSLHALQAFTDASHFLTFCICNGVPYLLVFYNTAVFCWMNSALLYCFRLVIEGKIMFVLLPGFCTLFFSAGFHLMIS